MGSYLCNSCNPMIDSENSGDEFRDLLIRIRESRSLNPFKQTEIVEMYEQPQSKRKEVMICSIDMNYCNRKMRDFDL